MSTKELVLCSICGAPIVGYGNNAQPVTDGVCCDRCNQSVVIPARIIEYREQYIGLYE